MTGVASSHSLVPKQQKGVGCAVIAANPLEVLALRSIWMIVGASPRGGWRDPGRTHSICTILCQAVQIRILWFVNFCYGMRLPVWLLCWVCLTLVQRPRSPCQVPAGSLSLLPSSPSPSVTFAWSIVLLRLRVHMHCIMHTTVLLRQGWLSCHRRQP